MKVKRWLGVGAIGLAVVVDDLATAPLTQNSVNMLIDTLGHVVAYSIIAASKRFRDTIDGRIRPEASRNRLRDFRP